MTAEYPRPKPAFVQDLSADVAFNWTCRLAEGEIEPDVTPYEADTGNRKAEWNNPGGPHHHSITCLWIWHDCPAILGPTTVAPGATFGWMPTGVGLHTLVQVDPLTIRASVVWPECCGLHGFITDGAWQPV